MLSIDLSRYVTRALPCELAMTAAICSPPYRWIARMSWSVMSGLFRTRSKSSSLRVSGYRWTLKESAPAWLRIASLTDALRP